MRPPVATWQGTRPPSGARAALARVRWSRIDWHVLLVALALLAAGIVFVRAMADADEAHLRDGISFAAHLKKVAVGLPALVAGLFVRPRWLRRNAYLLYGLAILLLLLVPVLGEARNDARRWIPLPFGFDLQPSELAKVALVLALARALYTNRLERARDWILPAVLALVPIALVAAQPDLGTALLVAPLTLGMLYLAGARGRAILGLVAAAALALVLAWQLDLVHDYQERRIETWLRSFDNEALIEGRNGAAFHTYQARVAIGNGGWRGTGLGRGVANQAGHLPERAADSIFAVVAEEAGLLGATFLVLLHLLLFALVLASAGRVRERFTRLVVGGAGLFFACHFFLHAGVSLGLIPMTGLTLPLLSTGGSSLLASFAVLGLALGLPTHGEPSLDEDAFRG